MAVDHTGTAPGLVGEADPRPRKAPTCAMRCKNAGCDSMEAMEMRVAGMPAHSRIYQCVKCKRTFSLQVGGAFEL